MIFNDYRGKKMNEYTLEAQVEFSIDWCSLGSSELLDEMPDVVYNNIEDYIKSSLKTLFPNINRYLELYYIDIFYDFAYIRGHAESMWTEYAYSAEVTMVLNISDQKLLNYYKIKCPEEINQRHRVLYEE